MTKAKGKAVKVGGVFGRLPSLDPTKTALYLLRLDPDESPEKTVREELYYNAAVEVVEDPMGNLHEGVPYESLLLTGANHLADSLTQTLDRYFSPLCYRRLNFEVHQSLYDNEAAVLFGDLIERGWGQPRGRLRLQVGHAFGDKASGTQPVSQSLDWWAGHERGIYALWAGDAGRAQTAGQPPQAAASTSFFGLKAFDLEMMSQVLVVQSSKDGPTAQIRKLVQETGIGIATPVLGELVAEASFTRDAQHDTYTAVLQRAGDPEERALHLMLTPDSAFNRVTGARRTDVDMLEIIGFYLPRPKAKGRVLGLSVRLDRDTMLCAHGQRVFGYSLDVLPGKERYLKARGKRTLALRRRKEMVLPKIGRVLRNPNSEEDLDERDFIVLCVDGLNPLGWIPFRVDDPQTHDRSVANCDVVYIRPHWVGSKGREAAEAKFRLDWLNQVCQLVVHDPNAGTERIGLAEFLIQERQMMGGRFKFANGELSYEEGTVFKQDLRDQSIFRVGPLRVKLHKARLDDDP